MSKHFDLIQQLEQEQSTRPKQATEQKPHIIGSGYRQYEASNWVKDEALRLVQRVFLLQTQKPPQVVVLAGIDHGNGCTQICGAVAEALAINSSGPVCLVEANFRSPDLAAVFGIQNQKGLTDALLSEGPILSFATQVANDNLWVIPSGPIAEDSPNLLTSERLTARFTELRSQFDFVIVDAPPLTRYADAIAIGHQTDGLILILEAGSTRKEAAQTAVTHLRASKVEILAAVLNKRIFPIPDQLYKRL
jgi:capsular exopolysaccharide synthesis family protein